MDPSIGAGPTQYGGPRIQVKGMYLLLVQVGQHGRIAVLLLSCLAWWYLGRQQTFNL